MTEISTLDLLYKVREQLTDDLAPFVFTDWSFCTCGHIYLASMGTVGGAHYVSDPPTASEYTEHIHQVAVALGYQDGGQPPWEYVSDLTISAAGGMERRVIKEHAIEVINAAIKAFESLPREAMEAIALGAHDAEMAA